MAIIISKNGKDAVKVEKSGFQMEDNLQQYIYDNPESIPLYEIKEDIRLLILAREFATESGPIDALGVDKDGEIYLVETKFYKNPDKRTVVAQVLDYGASLWSHFADFNDFVEQVSQHTNKDFNQTLNQRITEFFGITEDEVNALLENARVNLRNGNFKFVVLMDHLHDQLKDLIVFLNNNSQFTIYAVELEYYKHNDYEIIIPRIYGAEVKKSVGINTSRQPVPSDEEFVEAYKDSPEQSKVAEIINLLNKIREKPSNYANITASKSPKYLNFYVMTSYQDKVTISLPLNPEAEGGGLQVWITNKNHGPVEEVLNKKLTKYEKVPFKGQQYGKVGRIQLKDITLEQLETLLQDISKI